jgi:hypothetical protein
MDYYFATCFALGRHVKWLPKPSQPKGFVGVSRWLPGASYHGFIHSIPSQINPCTYASSLN